MIKKIKNFLAILSIAVLLSAQVGPVLAFDMPTAPDAPQAPIAPDAPTAPSAPSAPDAPQAPSAPQPVPDAPTAPQAPTLDQVLNSTPTPTPTEKPRHHHSDDPTPTPTDTATDAPKTSSTTSDGNTGDTTVKTGDITNSGVINSLGNSNLSTSEGANGSGGVAVINSGNGAGSENNGSAMVSDSTTIVQDNSGIVANNLNQDSISGQNSASKNTGGDSTISSGDANTTGTIITGLNTNFSGIAVSEFNVADDHVGDIVLDFGASCVSGCGTSGNAMVANANNGADTTNNASLSQATNNTTFQNNDGTVGNNMTLLSDSGNNTASKNTGGDSTIKTGDANVAANVLNFVNNNMAGNVVYGVVNIFGDLVGDILLPQSEVDKAFTNSGANTTLANAGNGTDSTNTVNYDQTSTNNSFQTNNADIENNLTLSATSGNNSVSGNTDGNSSITTGNTSVDANVLNVANSNVDGGNWWLVVVNEAGNWVGKLLGASVDSNFAGSAGTEFTVGQDGSITASNAGNGSDSTNTADLSQTTNNTTIQTNNGKVINNLNLTANTGENDASKNTGGDSTIKTGDAKVIANLVNFVNNNIKGGKLMVTVVNVFGSWLGDFVTPGQQKQQKADDPKLAQNPTSTPETHPVGGQSLSSNNTNNNNNNNSNAGTASSPTPTTSVIASSSSNDSSSGDLYTTADVRVSGVSKHTDDSNNVFGMSTKVGGKSGKITINLAWILILLPFVALFIIFRKKLFLGKVASRPNSEAVLPR